MQDNSETAEYQYGPCFVMNDAVLCVRLRAFDFSGGSARNSGALEAAAPSNEVGTRVGMMPMARVEQAAAPERLFRRIAGGAAPSASGASAERAPVIVRAASEQVRARGDVSGRRVRT